MQSYIKNAIFQKPASMKNINWYKYSKKDEF